jgi:hypothetical protein
MYTTSDRAPGVLTCASCVKESIDLAEHLRRRFGIVDSVQNCQDLLPPVAVLSDFAVSPQSILRYQQKHPPIYALLSVKAVTGTAALGQP